MGCSSEASMKCGRNSITEKSVTPSPLAYRSGRAAQLAANVHVRRGIRLGSPQDNPGAEGECLRCGMGSCQSVQLRTGVLRYNDAGSKGRWHGRSPCQRALGIHHPDLLPLSYFSQAHKRLQLVTDLRNALLGVIAGKCTVSVPLARPHRHRTALG